MMSWHAWQECTAATAIVRAEDGLLGEDEMSQLSGRALDLRNSAALLKLARMSVDATALKDSEPPCCAEPSHGAL